MRHSIVETWSAGNSAAGDAPGAPGRPRHAALRCCALGILLAVNGTLMRGLALNGNMMAVGARFVRDATTAPHYRLWSIDDHHPAMLRFDEGGAAIAVEVWDVPAAGLAQILLQEPPGLCIGKIRLSDGEETLGVLGEPALCAGRREITRWGGWRAYIAARNEEVSI